MIEGHIETVQPEGLVCGWVRDTEDTLPCHVLMRFEGRIVAETIARGFRGDLLRTGHGHGHHGFRARLMGPLPPGPCNLTLTLPRHGQTVAMGVLVPALRRSRPCIVERLLRAEQGWSVADLAGRPEALQAARLLTAMGPVRFVDGLFRFVLRRWPSAAEASVHTRALDHGTITAQALLVELLASRERADMKEPLPAPYDSDFPFVLV